MITVRRAGDRGRTDLGWLDSRHSFSFGGYRDAAWDGFRSLRVINDDRVAGGGGFAEHPHRDMEILSFVVEGALAHRDSTGAEGVVGAGGVQAMSAGRGVRHSEYNASETEPVRFLQVWIVPGVAGAEPAYTGVEGFGGARRDGLALAASGDGADGSVRINSDARVYTGVLSAGASVEHAVGEGRGVWVQAVRGGVRVNGVALSEGDGAAAEGERSVRIDQEGPGESEVLVFDLA